MRGFLLSITILMLFAQCDSNRVMENFSNLSGFWHKDSVVAFSFDIEDLEKTYNLKAEFSNRFTYPYHNLYFNYRLTSGDSVLEKELKEIILFDPKTGKPNGAGAGNLFSHEIYLLQNYTFGAMGEYRIELEQFMRMDSLPDIERIGARVEFYDGD